MITRLRKIFYGAESWDKNLIREVKDIDSPYGEPRERERSRQRVEVGLGFLTDQAKEKEDKAAKVALYRHPA
jgi:hypothetical protein